MVVASENEELGGLANYPMISYNITSIDVGTTRRILPMRHLLMVPSEEGEWNYYSEVAKV
jgi:hypothetical protein